jgi:hypothetical protein
LRRFDGLVEQARLEFRHEGRVDTSRRALV